MGKEFCFVIKPGTAFGHVIYTKITAFQILCPVKVNCNFKEQAVILNSHPDHLLPGNKVVIATPIFLRSQTASPAQKTIPGPCLSCMHSSKTSARTVGFFIPTERESVCLK